MKYIKVTIIKYSNIAAFFILTNIYIDNACYISVSSVGVFFSDLFRFS